MHKGRIVLVPFPFTDLSGQKVRPALVLYASKAEDCIVAFISSARGRNGHFEILIKATSSNGLKVDSVIRIDKIATLQKKIVLGEIGIAEKLVMASVEASLKKLFKL